MHHSRFEVWEGQTESLWHFHLVCGKISTNLRTGGFLIVVVLGRRTCVGHLDENSLVLDDHCCKCRHGGWCREYRFDGLDCLDGRNFDRYECLVGHNCDLRVDIRIGFYPNKTARLTCFGHCLYQILVDLEIGFYHDQLFFQLNVLSSLCRQFRDMVYTLCSNLFQAENLLCIYHKLLQGMVEVRMCSIRSPLDVSVRMQICIFYSPPFSRVRDFAVHQQKR